jgi:hypothetical protein
MNKVEIPIPDGAPARALVIAGAIAILGAATWFGTRPESADQGQSYVEDGSTGAMIGAYGPQAAPVVYRDASASPQRCDPWDVSPVAMEAILQEMVRRGWQPPTQGAALASLQPEDGPAITALDPNASVRVSVGRPPPTDPDVVLPPDGALGAESPAADVKGSATPQAPGAPPKATPTPPKTTPGAAPRPAPVQPPAAAPPTPPAPAPAPPLTVPTPEAIPG